MKRILLLILLLCFSVPDSYLAQNCDNLFSGGIELTQRYIDEEKGLSFSYPGGWLAIGYSAFTDIYPLFGEYTDSGNVYMTVRVVNTWENRLDIELDMSALQALEQATSVLPVMDFNSDDIVVYKINDNTIASTTYRINDGYFITAIVETANGLIFTQAREETAAARDNIEDIYFSIIETMDYSPGEISTNVRPNDCTFLEDSIRYTDDSQEFSFTYPDGWEVERTEHSINLLPRGDDYSNFADVAIEFNFFTENFYNSTGIDANNNFDETIDTFIAYIEESGLEDENPWEFVAGENRVLEFRSTQNNESSVIVMLIDTGDGLLMGRASGFEDQVNDLDIIFFAIIQSIEYIP